jgi:hypothetical protein
VCGRMENEVGWEVNGAGGRRGCGWEEHMDRSRYVGARRDVER